MERSLLPRGIRQELDEIKYPLAGTKIDLPQVNSEEVKKLVKKIYEKLVENLRDKGDRTKYLGRNLLEILHPMSAQPDIANIKKFWLVLLADTRIPNHSIWEHLKITTAINAFRN